MSDSGFYVRLIDGDLTELVPRPSLFGRPRATPQSQHIATLRTEAKRLSNKLAQVNRELAALGVFDG